MKRISHSLVLVAFPLTRKSWRTGACASPEKRTARLFFRSVRLQGTIGVRGKEAALLTTIDTVLKSTGSVRPGPYACGSHGLPRASCMELPQLTPVTPLCQFRLKIPHCTGRKFPTPNLHRPVQNRCGDDRIAEDRSPVPVAFVGGHSSRNWPPARMSLGRSISFDSRS